MQYVNQHMSMWFRLINYGIENKKKSVRGRFNQERFLAVNHETDQIGLELDLIMPWQSYN